MSLANKTLAELARLRAGVGPVRTEQDGSPYNSYPNGPPSAGDGVDTGDAMLCNLIITPTGGDTTWTLLGRSEPADAFEELDGWRGISTPDGVALKYRVWCETEGELYVRVDSGGTEVKVELEPCNG